MEEMNKSAKTAKEPIKKLPYKEEKAAKQYKKAQAYRESYKEKERMSKDNRQSSYSQNNYSQNNYSQNNYSQNKGIDKYDLCDSMALLLKDKIAADQNLFTTFEMKTVKSFFAEFADRPAQTADNRIREDSTRDNSRRENSNREEPKKIVCKGSDKCIVWKCIFEHPDSRRKECECSEKNCNKLHTWQALCKNPKHPDNCKFAHHIDELRERLSQREQDVSKEQIIE